MKYSGRIAAILILLTTIVLWHIAYFVVSDPASYRFFIRSGLIRVDSLFTLLLLPLFWWMGKQYDEAKFHSDRDPLTTLYNRRYIFDVFPALIERANANNEEVRVFVVDIDRFKEINDTRGHEIGDAVIKDVAEGLLDNTERTDLVARWGGDEFLIIAARNRKDIVLTEWLDLDNFIAEASERMGMDLSLSIGMAVYPIHGLTADDLIRVADQNMYIRKHSRTEDVSMYQS